MTVYKYQISFCDTTELHMPVGAEILCVQVQGDVPTIWAKVDPSAPEESRTIYVVGTGHLVPDLAGDYIGTIQLKGLVWHFFERQVA